METPSRLHQIPGTISLAETPIKTYHKERRQNDLQLQPTRIANTEVYIDYRRIPQPIIILSSQELLQPEVQQLPITDPAIIIPDVPLDNIGNPRITEPLRRSSFLEHIGKNILHLTKSIRRSVTVLQRHQSVQNRARLY